MQVAGGALPVSLSDTVRLLKERGLVGLRSRLRRASTATWTASARPPRSPGRRRQGYDAVVCAIGPGIVGTGSALGHGALALADAANVAAALGGRPVLAVRVSDADPRERHRGISHHTRAVLELCLADVVPAWPEDVGDGRLGGGVRRAAALHMGRGIDDDPGFFRAAYAAGVVARELAG